MKLFHKQEKKKTGRPAICLSLNCRNLDEVKADLENYGAYCQLIEWRADFCDGSAFFSKENYIALLTRVKLLSGKKKLMVTYKGQGETANKVLRWSLGIADMIDISWDNPQIASLIRDAHRKNTEVIVSFHGEKMLPEKEIAEQFLRMEKLHGDYLKIALPAEEEKDMYELLEGSLVYSGLKNSRPVIAVAMGEEGQASRICAGDFGSVITFACGTKKTAPGQLDAKSMKAYLDRYYQGRRN